MQRRHTGWITDLNFENGQEVHCSSAYEKLKKKARIYVYIVKVTFGLVLFSDEANSKSIYLKGFSK